MQLDSAENTVQIKYDTFVEVSTISEQKKILIQAIASAKPIEINVASVKVMDLQSLQLLISFVQMARKKQLLITWINASDEFIEIVTLVGVLEGLGLKA